MDGLSHEVVGDMAISLEKAKEESSLSAIPVTERVFALIIHGILHIVGFHHEQGGKEEKRMRDREKELLSFVTSHRLYKKNLIR